MFNHKLVSPARRKPVEKARRLSMGIKWEDLRTFMACLCVLLILAGLFGFVGRRSVQDERVTIRKDGRIVATADLKTGIMHAIGYAQAGIEDQRSAAECEAKTNLLECALQLKGKIDEDGIASAVTRHCVPGPCLTQKDGSITVSFYAEIPAAYLPKGGDALIKSF